MRARGLFLMLFAFPLLPTVVHSATTSQVTSSATAYDIFAKANAYWTAQHYPAYIRYIVRVTVTERGRTRSEDYDSAFNNIDGSTWVNPVSDYEITHRPTGGGLRFCVSLGSSGPGCGGGMQPAPRTDFLGVPLLSPIYSFGMAPPPRATAPSSPSPEQIVADVRRFFHDPNPRASTPRPLPTAPFPEIATVIAVDRNYNILLLGIENVDGTRCYHLRLTPLNDPNKFRLRDVWIDTTTFATQRLIEALNFIDSPGPQVPWQVDFADVDGSHYISTEKPLRELDYAGVHYSEATIAFQSIQSLASPKAAPMFATSLVLREP